MYSSVVVVACSLSLPVCSFVPIIVTSPYEAKYKAQYTVKPKLYIHIKDLVTKFLLQWEPHVCIVTILVEIYTPVRFVIVDV